MSEGLSPEEKETARDISRRHKRLGMAVDVNKESSAWVEEARPAYEYLLRLKSDQQQGGAREADIEAIDRVLHMMPQTIADELKEREDRVMKIDPDSTLAEDNRNRLEGVVAYGARHKEEHLNEYIETARQDAEAAGVHIDVAQPDGK